MVGVVIGQHLQSRGIKQKWLAEELGISEARLSSIVAGKSPVNAELLFRVSEVLEVSSDIFNPLLLQKEE